MRDAKAAELCQRDVVELFRYLNPMWIVVIMQILEDLMAAGLFYPNPERYAAQLSQAGIDVDRMKVAMAAVLHKAGQSITGQKFTEIYGDKIRKLPGQQQREVLEYWRAGPRPGLVAGTAPVSPSIANESFFDKYVDMFTACKYDMNYKVPKDASFYYSPILQLTYNDGATLEMNIETDFPQPVFRFTPEGARDQMARGFIGRGGRIFPAKIAPRTTPRLYRARGEALRMQDEDFGRFATVGMTGVAFVLSVPAMPAGAPLEGLMATKVTRQRVAGVGQAASVVEQIESSLPGGARVISKGRGHVVYRLPEGQMRIRFDARGAKTLQGANPGRNYTKDGLAGLTNEGEVFVHEGRHRAIGAANGDAIPADLGGVSGQPHLLDLEFSEQVAQPGGVYVRNLNIDYTQVDVGAAEADRLWSERHGI